MEIKWVVITTPATTDNITPKFAYIYNSKISVKFENKKSSKIKYFLLWEM